MATVTNDTTNLGEPFLVRAASPHALWFADWADGTIKRLSASLAVGDAAVRVSNHYSNLVTRIDPASTKVVARISLNGYPSDASGGSTSSILGP